MADFENGASGTTIALREWDCFIDALCTASLNHALQTVERLHGIDGRKRVERAVKSLVMVGPKGVTITYGERRGNRARTGAGPLGIVAPSTTRQQRNESRTAARRLRNTLDNLVDGLDAAGAGPRNRKGIGDAARRA